MDNQELTKLRQQLYDKNINMVALAEEYGCRASFVSQFFAGKVFSKPFMDFITKKTGGNRK